MSIELTVTGMTCEGCEEVVEHALTMVDGIEEVEADRYEDVATVDGEADRDVLIEKVELAGYEAE